MSFPASNSCDVPAFMRLGRPKARVPRGYSQLLRDANVDEAYVRRVIRSEELFDKNVPLRDESPLALQYERWLQALTAELGLKWHDRLVGQLTYLQFANVGLHNDGSLQPYGLPEDGGEDYFYANLHLHGSGWLVLQPDPDAEPVEHRIECGELYHFDQRLEHGWRSDGPGLDRIISLELSESAVLELMGQPGAS